MEAAQRAVELDPSSGTTHWHLARTHFWRNEVPEGVTEAERALALNPNNAFVLAAAGTYMAPTSRDNLKRGMQLASKALHIDPNGPGWYHVPDILFHYDRREYEAALAASLKMSMPKFFHTYMWRTAIYGQLGRSAEAAASRDKLLQLYPAYGKNARREFQKFNVNPDLGGHLIEGLRKGGIDIPERVFLYRLARARQHSRHGLQHWLSTAGRQRVSLSPGPNGLLALRMEHCTAGVRRCTRSSEERLVSSPSLRFPCLASARCSRRPWCG